MKTEVPRSISEPEAVATGSRPSLIKCFLTLDPVGTRSRPSLIKCFLKLDPVATAPGSDTVAVVDTKFR